MRSFAVVSACVAALLMFASAATADPPASTPDAQTGFFGYDLKFDVIGALGGSASAPAVLLKMTVGEAAIGLSNGTGGRYVTAGFWHPGILRELDVSEPGGELAFALMPVAPNPAVRRATIHYVIPGSPGADLLASVRVFDISGRLVRVLATGRHAPGEYTVTWDGFNSAGTRLGAGAFFVELEAGANRAVRRVILLR